MEIKLPQGLYEEWRLRFGEVLAVLMVAQVEALRSITAQEPRRETTDMAISAHLKQHSPKAGPDGKRWAVRGIPLGGGSCSTAGVFSLKENACAFLRFWGAFVNTEVKLAEIEIGTDPWGKEPLDSWETCWLTKSVNLVRPVGIEPTNTTV